MFTVITIAFIAVMTGIYIGYREEGSSGIYFGGLLGALLGILLGFIIALAVGCTLPRVNMSSGPFTLVSMKTENGISGAFVIGTGNLHSRASYQMLLRNEDGSMTPYSVTADDKVRLIEDSSLKDKGLWIVTYNRPNPASLICNWVLFLSNSTQIVSHEIRVPTGSIIQNFKVD